jgi:hypothetical protein
MNNAASAIAHAEQPYPPGEPPGQELKDLIAAAPAASATSIRQRERLVRVGRVHHPGESE